MSMPEPVRLSIEGEVGVVVIDSPPVNALSVSVRRGLAAAVLKANDDPAVHGLVLICEGRTFMAGADITEFGRPPEEPGLPEVVAALEASAKPVVAAIHGTALGGGLEIALGCHYRIAAPSARLGLPEVKLGLLPGAGGTQRLPRLVGVGAALKMIALGEPVAAADALGIGLIDAVAGSEDLRVEAIRYCQALIADQRGPVRLREKPVPGLQSPEIFDAFLAEHARRFRGFEAPLACIKAVQAAVDLDFDAGMACERDLFISLVTGAQSAAQRHVFFAERAAAKVADLPAGTPPRTIASVGVVGAGTIGGGIAMNFLNAGLPVRIVEQTAEALERGVAAIRRNYEATVAKGRLTPEQMEARMGLLSSGLAIEALADCDLIVEAVFEELAIKTELFARLDAIARPGAILATNTSYLDVDVIAAATGRPESVIGLHFFSPANVMKLLEVVRGAKTAPTVIATAMAVGRVIGKTAVLVGVCHGFVGNRMLAQRQTEAQKLVMEGAMPWDIDRVLQAFGMPMGPFAMADLAGLDLGWSRERSRGETLRDRLCELDRRGQKTGAGFYDYDDWRRPTPSPVVEQLIAEAVAGAGVAAREISDQEILERCLYPMVNEGAAILEEGIAQRASDIDVVWVYGYGWPVYRGGPMFWADSLGLKTVVEGLTRHGRALGPTFSLSPLLERLAREGGRFSPL